MFAKYAGSITEMQQGTNSASTPPKKEARTAVPRRVVDTQRTPGLVGSYRPDGPGTTLLNSDSRIPVDGAPR